MSEAVKALLDYQQADEDGVMVLTSRQAIHEVADRIKELEDECRIQYQDGFHDGEDKGNTILKEWWDKFNAQADRIEQLEAEAKTRTLDYLGQVGQLSEELERVKREAERAQDAHGVRFLNYLEETARLSDEITRLRAALEWALDKAATEHPHYPYRDGGKWTFPYLVDNAGGFGGGVGNAYFETALEAVERAALGEQK